MSTLQQHQHGCSSWSSYYHGQREGNSRSINPPVPSAPSSTTQQQQRAQPHKRSGVGQRLLSLLRSLDSKKQNTTTTNNNDLILRETMELFQQLIASVHRRGVLEGDVAVAQQILAATTTTMTTTRHKRHSHSGNSSRHRKSKQRGGGFGGGIPSSSAAVNDLSLHNTDDATGDAALLDSQLLWSALARVLETSNNNKKGIISDNEDDDNDDKVVLSKILVLAAAADVCTAACEYLKTRPNPDPCFLAEYELVACHGRAFLLGIEQHTGALLRQRLLWGQRQSQPDDPPEHMLDTGRTSSGCSSTMDISYALTACLRTASSLISLFGHKLSRVNLQGLQHMAESCLFLLDAGGARVVLDPGVTAAAAVLWATLPLAGGTTDQRTPAVRWNRAVAETVDRLMEALRIVVPIGVLSSGGSSSTIGGKKKKASPMEKEILLPTDNSVWNIVQERWIPSIEQAQSEEEKVQQFLQLVNGLVLVLQALLAREVVGVGAATALTVQAQLMGCEVNVEALLSLVDCLLNFSTAAESKFYATKKRLRQEAISDGLLSPAAMASDVANPLRWLGHALLDSVVTALGTAALTPYARRISKMVHSALLASSSWTLRQALDPTAALLQQGKKRPRWLHTSLALRTCAIRSFQRVVLMFGTDPQPILTDSSSAATARPWKAQGSAMDRAISLVCGVVVEEIVTDQQLGSRDDWGTFEERVQLVTAALDALVASLNCGGEFWSITTRSLIDSVTTTCFSVAQQGHPLTSQPSIQTAILSLGTASVITPWQDGATSATTLFDSLQGLASAWSCRHPSVASVAVAALSICKAQSCPRVPALQIVTRSSPSYGGGGAAQYSTIINNNNNNVYPEATVEVLANKLEVVREDEKRARLREVEEAATDTAAKVLAIAVENLESKPPKKLKSSAPEVPLNVLTTVVEAKKSEEKNSESSFTQTRENIAASDETIEQAQVEPIEAHRKKQSIDKTLVDPEAIRHESGVAGSEEVDDEDDLPMIVDCGPDDGE